MSTTLMIRNLGPDINTSSLVHLLEATGDLDYIDFVYVPVDLDSKVCRGIAFVNFFCLDATKDFLVKWDNTKYINGVDLCKQRACTRLNVRVAKRQGFNACIACQKRKKDTRLAPWIRLKSPLNSSEDKYEQSPSESSIFLMPPPGLDLPVRPPPGLEDVLRMRTGYVRTLICFAT